MDWTQLLEEYNHLQTIYGDPNLDSIISGGQKENPKICFTFMNPTGRNISSQKDWTSLKAPWLGTKNVWKIFKESNLLTEEIFEEIKKRRTEDWDYTFSELVYNHMQEQGIYITNLGKCTQIDARPLPNSVFKEYRKYFLKELELVKPDKIITFGNQVSSILLEENISVSKDRRKIFELEIGNTKIPVLPIYYPVGQGQRNMPLAIEDINWFLNN